MVANAGGLLALMSFCWLFGHSLPQYVVRKKFFLEPSASLFSCLNFFNRLVSGQQEPCPQSQIRPLEALSFAMITYHSPFDFGESLEPKDSLKWVSLFEIRRASCEKFDETKV